MTNQTQQVTQPKQTPAKAVVPPVESPIITVPDKPGRSQSMVQIDLSKAVPQLEKIIVGLSGRIGLDKGGGYGSGSPEEKEAAKLIQSSLNKALKALGSRTSIAVDGDIRPGGSTAKAVAEFIDLENAQREKRNGGALNNIPRGTKELGTVVLASLAHYEDRILDKRYSVSGNVGGANLATLRPVLANEHYVFVGSTKGAEAAELNRLITVATTKDPQVKDVKLSGNVVTPEGAAALQSLNIAKITQPIFDPSQNVITTIGPATTRHLLQKVAELDLKPAALPPAAPKK